MWGVGGGVGVGMEGAGGDEDSRGLCVVLNNVLDGK